MVGQPRLPAARAPAIILALTAALAGWGAPGAGAQGGASLQGVEGQQATYQMPFIDCASTGVTIDWGDGTPPTQASYSNGQFSGTHAYGEEGTYDGSEFCSSTRRATFTVQVADAQLSASGQSIEAAPGQMFAGTVATLTDTDPAGTASDYSASIAWGDGVTSTGTVSPHGGAFAVSGSHTYSSAGSYTVTVTIEDAGGASVQTETLATVAPAAPQAKFTLPAEVHLGQQVTLDAGASRQPGFAIRSFDWTVNGRQLADCAGVTSEVVTRTLPVGVDVLTLTVVDTGGAVFTTTHTLTVTGASAVRDSPSPAPRAASARALRLRTLALPMAAACLKDASDPGGAGVAPPVPGAPSSGCSQQVQSGIVDAVGCLTEYSDTLDVLEMGVRAGYKTFSSFSTVVAGPDGMPAKPGTNLPGVASSADSQTLVAMAGELVAQELGANGGYSGACQYLQQLLSDAQQSQNRAQAQLWQEQLKQLGCMPVPDGTQEGPNGAQGAPPPLEHAALDAGAGVPVTTAPTHPARLAAAGAARALGGVQAIPGSIYVETAGDACSPTPVPTGRTYGAAAVSTVCLDLYVATGPVRLNGIDYDPAPGGELVIAPQLNLVISQSASQSLDGLLLDPGQPFQPVNYLLPTSAQTQPGSDFPALSVPDIRQTIAQQPPQNRSAASQILDALSSVGGFLSVGGLNVSFENDTALISFQVQLPDPPFNGGGGQPVTAAVFARVGASEAFHVVYGFLGNRSGGANVDFGAFQLQSFGICYREQYSPDQSTDPTNPDPHVDPCPSITGLSAGDDQSFGPDAWMATGEVNIAGAVDVAFRPGLLQLPGCSQAIPLGFVFSDGHLTLAGASLTVSGGVDLTPIPGLVTLNGLAVGFKQLPDYTVMAGCLDLGVIKLLQITGNVFVVETNHGYRYDFTGDELGNGVLQPTGGSYPYTTHLAIGASGIVTLTLPSPVGSFPLANAYGLYVDDPPAIFFGGGLCFTIPNGDCHNPPGTSIAVDAGVDGAIGLAGGSPPPFDFEGHAHLSAQVLGQSVFDGYLAAIISHDPGGGGGIGVCGQASVGSFTGSAGLAYHWGDGVLDVLENDITLNAPCEDGWLTDPAQRLSVNVQGPARDARAAGGAVTVRIRRRARALNFDVHGVGGAPEVNLSGPGGERRGAFTLVRLPPLDETLVVVRRPRRGVYRIAALPGSAPISEVVPKEAYAPAVSARVTGRGQSRRLVYRVAAEPGQTVRFFELSPQVDRLLGTARGSRGSIPFTATSGRGRRLIVAEIEVNQVPQARIAVTSYRAPALVRLARVRHLRVTRRGASLTVAFAPVSGARGYEVYVVASNGARRMLLARRPRATLAPVFLDAAGTIAVRALGDGIYTADGPAARVRFAAVTSRHPGSRPRLRSRRRRRR
jgi:PKD repeat protein